MSLFTDPHRESKASFKRGDIHLGVWAIQRFMNKVYPVSNVLENGVFGPQTDQWVRKYQADTKLVSDGIVGPNTQKRMVRSCVVRAPYGAQIPRGLVEGIISGESGNYLSAVNDKVAGGLDLGLTQRRVSGPPFSAEAVQSAMDPVYSVARTVQELYDNAMKFRVNRHPACPFNSWELAVLNHNWPAAADRYWRYGRLPEPNRVATWAPAGVPASAKTWDGWARFYVDLMTKDVQF